MNPLEVITLCNQKWDFRQLYQKCLDLFICPMCGSKMRLFTSHSDFTQIVKCPGRYCNFKISIKYHPRFSMITSPVPQRQLAKMKIKSYIKGHIDEIWNDLDFVTQCTTQNICPHCGWNLKKEFSKNGIRFRCSVISVKPFLNVPEYRDLEGPCCGFLAFMRIGDFHNPKSIKEVRLPLCL